ncbi:NAD-dependent epimerase/dehydratase family protein [Pararhodonellum marinum]|uniref:NAD-dependent epimerase/dehydratase family protein n=1 Tax=Pararhodonellum marinum TaxID=2755358 RepID=UPI00188E895E|nr:NAD-dependent epimerase/dehydratase family protein [Pararhodonellum marinum]
MKILITGATGYLGNALLHHLLGLGHQIQVLVREPKSFTFPKNEMLHVVKGDLRSFQDCMHALQGCEVLYHLAALINFRPKRYLDVYEVNTFGTSNLLKASWQLGLKKIVFCSSTGVYEPQNGKILNENSPCLFHKKRPYENSKLWAEREVISYARKGLPAVIASPSRIYGPSPGHQGSGLNNFIRKIQSNYIVPIPDFVNSIGNYTYIQDVVNGLELAMTFGKSGQKYILGGENIGYDTLMKCLKIHFNANVQYLKIPLGLIKTFCPLLDDSFLVKLFPKIPPTYLIERLTQNLAFNCNKAKDELGYEIVPFDEGIKQSVAHYRAFHVPNIYLKTHL